MGNYIKRGQNNINIIFTFPFLNRDISVDFWFDWMKFALGIDLEWFINFPKLIGDFTIGFSILFFGVSLFIRVF